MEEKFSPGLLKLKKKKNHNYKTVMRWARGLDVAQRMLDDIEQVVDINGCIAVYLEANSFIRFITKIRQPFSRQPALPAASLLVFNSSQKNWTGLAKRAAQNKPTSSVGMYIKKRTKIYRKKSGWCDAENKDLKRSLCFLNKYKDQATVFTTTSFASGIAVGLQLKPKKLDWFSKEGGTKQTYKQCWHVH